MPKDKKILYFYAVRMSFVIKDIEILRSQYAVDEYQLSTKVKWQIPFRLVHQFFYILSNIRSTGLMVCFFAGYHSLIPAFLGYIFGKRVIICLGGADAYRFPEFNYGHFNKLLIGKCTCWSARMASLLVPVDDSLIYSESDYYDPRYAVQGIRHFCHRLRTPFQTLRLEYDPELFYNKSKEKMANSFITVGFGIEGPSFVRKGIDLIIAVAKQLPDSSFTIIGCEASSIDVPFTDNVRFLPPVPYRQLPDYYSGHRFYLQLSIAEGFPSAICEAMLCECVPVGSNVAAIPYIIGDTGFIIEKRNVDLLKMNLEKIQSSVDLDQMGKNARKRIMDHFYPGSRRHGLINIIEQS